MSALSRRVLPILVAAVLAFVGTATRAQQPPALFTPVAGPLGAAADQRVNRNPSSLRSRLVTIDLGQLGSRDSGLDRGTTLQLNLFEDASYLAVLDRIDRTGDGFVWVGHVQGVPMSMVTLATGNGVMSGSVILPEAAYAIRFAGDGVHAVVQVDQRAFPKDAEPEQAIAVPQAPPNAAADTPAEERDDGSIIDMMVLYTPAAAAAAGGQSAMDALIASSISVTNTSFSNMSMTPRVRLVYSALIGYTETGNISTDRSNIVNGVGVFSGVNALRNSQAADVVTLLVNSPSPPFCGVSGISSSPLSTAFAPQAYDVVEQICAVDNLSFPHELGHIMGLRHDWYVDATKTPYTYGHGYVNIGATSATRWRTIMAYPDKCTDQGIFCSRLPYWSSPLFTLTGSPMGIAEGTSTACVVGNLNNPPCDADERRVLLNTAFTVANFRQSAPVTLPLTVTSLTPNVALPATLGTPITWTATTTGGTQPLQYQFWRYTDGQGWSIGQPFSASNTFTWFPPAGTNALQVWVKNSGSTAAQYDAWLGTGYFTIAAPTATVSALRSDVALPAPFNVPITFTATATSTGGAVEYKFVRYSASTGWVVGREYSSNNVYSWYPPLGANALQVWVRAAGSAAAYQDYLSTGLFDVALPAPKINFIQTNVQFPAASSSTIIWTVNASGGAGPLEYKFHRFDQSTGTWTVLRDWGSSNQASWTPGDAGIGTHWLQVWVRNVGSRATFDDWRSTDGFIVSPTTVNLVANRSLTGLHLNDIVTWTASVTGAPGPWEYKFVAYDGSGWKVLQDYSSRPTVSWFPPAATCALQVWVRTVGSSAAWEQYQGTGLFVVSP